jgi:hypothetical protein
MTGVGRVGVVRPLVTSRPGMGGRTSTEEVYAMTEGQPAPGGFKTIGVKLPDPVHAQLTLIANLDGISLTDAIRQAIEGYIERKRGEGDLAERAARALDEIEREAATRRDALQSLFGQHAQAATDTGPSRRRPRGEQPS